MKSPVHKLLDHLDDSLAKHRAKKPAAKDEPDGDEPEEGKKKRPPFAKEER